MKRNIQKFISLITATCFVLLSFNGTIFCQYTNTLNYSTGIVQNLLSKDLGSVTYSKIKDSQNIVINIQDLHGNIKVQKNINDILKYLTDNNIIKSIYLEGASGKVDISWLKKSDTQNKNGITDTLFNIGMLTGTEFFSINDNKNIPLYGLEDKIIHQENINRLALMINDGSFIKEKLSGIKKDLNLLNNKYVNSDNKKFINFLNGYKNKKITAPEFYSTLLKYIETVSSNPDKYNNLVNLQKDDYPNILLFMELLSLDKKTNKEKLSVELQNILTIVKNNLKSKEYFEFLSFTDNATNLTKLIYYLQDFSTKNNLNLIENYPNIYHAIECQNHYQNINFTEMVNEEKVITNNIKAALSYNSDEYETIFLNDFYTYLEKALTNNLEFQDYDYFINSIDKFELLYPKYVVYNQLKDIKIYIENSIQFYKVNNERNNIFAEKIKNDINSNDKDKDKNIIIIITGGYHTEGLKEIFSKQNISFIAVTPNLTDINNNSTIYNNVISEESNQYRNNTLAFTVASQMQDIIFVKTLITAALQNKVPFNQIKQICANVFKENFIDNGTDFIITINSEPITITQQNGYAVFVSDIDSSQYESLNKDLSVLAQDITTEDNKVGIKLFLNLLNVINHFYSFDNFSLTQQNDILKAIINTLVFFVEDLNIRFSNGFQRTDIEQYINDEIINNPKIKDKKINGIDINTARFLPVIIQQILYENDKTEKQIKSRIKKAKQKVTDDIESIFLYKHYDDSLQISGLISTIIKEILFFAKNSDNQSLNPIIKTYLVKFIDISQILSYIAVSAFSLDEGSKGISLNQGLIGITKDSLYTTLVEGMGHEFAHEMLLLIKDFLTTGKTKNLVHETHSYIFSILFTQIFNELLKSSFSDEQEYRDYDKFLIDLDKLYSDTIKRNLTDKTQTMEEINDVHVSALNFINTLNRCFDKNGKVMDIQNLIFLAETIREVFADKDFDNFPYPAVFYTILMEFAKKTNPNSTGVLEKYYSQIINTTKFFTMNEQDGDSLLIETFANVLLTGTSQQIESFIQDKIIAPIKDIEKYRKILRSYYTRYLNTDPNLYEIVDDICFTILGNKVVLLKGNISEKTLKLLSETFKQLKYFLEIEVKNPKVVLNKLLQFLKEEKDIENLSSGDMENIFIKAMNVIFTDSSLLKSITENNSRTNETINKVLPEILKRHNKVLNLEKTINLILNPSIYQNIDITKEILKTTGDLETALEIITELFVSLVKDYNLFFNTGIDDYTKDKQTISQVPTDIFLKLPSFIQEILYNAETTNITKNQNEFTREYFIQNKNKTNALLKLVLKEIYTLLENKEYTDLLSIPDTNDLIIFAGFIPSGVSNGKSIAVNPTDESFLNVIAHELGHVLFTSAGFSQYKSTTVHELFAYTLGLLATTAYNDTDIETQKMLPATYENLTDNDEHSLPKTLLQLIIDIKGSPLTESQLLSILKTCKTILKDDVSKITNIELAYRILELLEQDKSFMQGFMPNELTIKLETVLDESQERKEKIIQQIFKDTDSPNILIIDKETFIRNKEEGSVFIDRQTINEIFDKEGNVIEGKEQDFRYLVELVKLQIIQQYDLTNQQRAANFEKLYICFKDLKNMLKYAPFNGYFITFTKENNRKIVNDQELIYINPEYLKKIDSSKYSEYLTSLISLRFLENKFNKEFNVDAKFDFYINSDNLDNIPIDLQKFSNIMKPYEYLKQEYDKHHSKQQKIEQAIEIILNKNKVKDKKLFADKIINLMLLVENPNIEFTSIDFFRLLSANTNHSAMRQVYNNLIEVYSYLIKNNILTFNSSFNKEIENYINSTETDNLDGVEINIAERMPSFIQSILYKNMILEESFKKSPIFIKKAKYKSDKLNGLLNIISEDITKIVTTIYPGLDKEILSSQIFFSSLERLTDGVNYGNNKIAISNKLINRYSYSPNALTIELLKTISHELGHEELNLKGVSESGNMIDTLHELYAYLVETLLIKAYSKAKGIKETNTVFASNENVGIIGKITDDVFILKSIIKDFLLKRKDEHDQALDILLLLHQSQYKDLFPIEKMIETLDIIESFAKGITFEDDGITKTLRVDDLNMQAVSFFMLMFMFGGEMDISEQKFLALGKSLTIFNTELFDPNKVLEAFIKKDTDYIYHLIDEITVKGDARTKELNEMLFGNKTFEFNGQSYGYSITTNNSENGLLKDGKILIYFAPNEIKFLVNNLDTKKAKTIKRKADILTTKISQNPTVFVLAQQVRIVTKNDTAIKSVRKAVQAPIQRTLGIATFILNLLELFKDLLIPSPFTNSKSINIVYYDNLDLIEPAKNILSVYVSDQEIEGIPFELTEYTINGRSLRISYDKKSNFITAYCPQASKQEIIEMTAKYIKSNIASQKNNVNLKNIVIDSTVLPDTITYHLSQENEGFACVSSAFMELGISFIEDLLKLDDIESVMFAKQIYDYIGNLPFKQLSKILQDKSLEGSQIIIDGDNLLREFTPNQMLLKAILKTTKLKVIIKVSSKEEMEKIHDIYELTDFMLETQKDNTVNRNIVEYTPSEGIIQKAPVSYIELTDLTNIEDKLENIPSHQAIVISVNADSAKNINISDNMILNSLKITLTRILKSKTISTKTAGNMGKELAKQITVSDEEKEKLANRYDEVKKSLTKDSLTKIMTDFPDVFTSEVTSYMEKLFDRDGEEITPAIAAFIDNFLNDILYDDNIDQLEISIQIDDIKHYKSILSAA